VTQMDRHRAIGTILVVALSGFLMGFDGSLFTGAVGFIETEFSLSSFEVGWAVTSMAVASTVSIFISGPLADRFGRRTLLRLATCMFAASALLAALSENFATLIVARLLGGFGVGAVLITAPMYVAEISPSALRGRMVSFNQLFIVLGALTAFVSNLFIVRIGGTAEWNWRWMLGIGLVPAVPYFFALLVIPESPRWLAMHNQLPAARRVLARLTGTERADRELEAMLESQRQHHLAHLGPPATGPDAFLALNEELGDLLRDCGAALDDLPFHQIVSRRAEERDWIDADMGQKPPILGGERCGLEYRRNRRGVDRYHAHAARGQRFVQHPPVAIDDHRRWRIHAAQ